ncbi:hypothetical protein TrST_g9617 [Triparma strigata]|uniref:Uncharacterized protein n=1 Tax=Triparma strigata TaxID=1606541 RepID=A0A9W6ZQF3_9STRA|nr:hypothetical protein TrST_g9617 [Triparma strigata]
MRLLILLILVISLQRSQTFSLTSRSLGLPPVCKRATSLTVIREGSLGQATAKLGRVPYGEESRKYRRTVFKQRDWLKHRSDTRLFDNLRKTIKSGVVRAILLEVYTATAIAAFVCCWNALIGGYVDFSGIAHSGYDSPLQPYLLLSLPSLPFTLSSSSLGLLLVFRTNASYGRWLEGRKEWGRIMSHSNNILRQASVWNTNFEPQEELHDLRQSIWSFSRSLTRILRGDEDEENTILQLNLRAPPFHRALISTSPEVRAAVALQKLSVTMDGLSIDEKKKVEMDKSVIIMNDASNSVERIYSSPVPLVYTRHTARFLSSYLLLLPLGLYPSFETSWNHISMIPATAVVAIFLFGIDELAIQLEEPFSILPLELMCEKMDLINEAYVKFE